MNLIECHLSKWWTWCAGGLGVGAHGSELLKFEMRQRISNAIFMAGDVSGSQNKVVENAWAS